MVVKRNTVKTVQTKPRGTVEVTCILSGKCERISQTKLIKQAAKFKFDNIEEYTKYYITKDCIKELRQGFTEKQIQKKHNIENGVQVPFNILRHYVKKFKNREKIEKIEKRKEVLKFMQDKNSAYIVKPRAPQYIDLTNEKQVAELTKSSCLRPDIFLNNDRSCNLCHIYQLCKCPIKHWDDPSERRGKRKK
jgi:hypothetical protein